MVIELMIKLSPSQLGIVGLVIVGLGLSGCSVASLSPDEVIQRFAQATADLRNFHYDATLSLAGNVPNALGSRLNNVQVRLVGDVSSQDESNPRFLAQVSLQADSNDGNVQLAGQLVSLPDYTYFKLTDLAVPTLLPVALGADSRWYRIKQPENESVSKRLGTQSVKSLTPDQVQSLHDAIANTVLLDVVEILPDETIFNQRSYHYRVKLRENDFNYLLTQISQITGIAIPDDSDQLSAYLVDLWINKRNFHLARLKVSDIYLSNGVPVSFALDLGMTNHNAKINIEEPRVSEELDIKNLLDQFGQW